MHPVSLSKPWEPFLDICKKKRGHRPRAFALEVSHAYFFGVKVRLYFFVGKLYAWIAFTSQPHPPIHAVSAYPAPQLVKSSGFAYALFAFDVRNFRFSAHFLSSFRPKNSDGLNFSRFLGRKQNTHKNQKAFILRRFPCITL